MEYIVNYPKIEHSDELVNLNRKFLIDNLSPEQREKGFIRIEYSIDDFKTFVKNREIVVAFNFDEIVAYYLIGRKSETTEIDYQREMTNKIVEKYRYSEEKIGYGCQVCIDQDFRHFGLFKKMLQALTKSVKRKYDYLLCSISDFNPASLKAHQKNGWEYIDKTETTNFYIYNIKKNKDL